MFTIHGVIGLLWRYDSRGTACKKVWLAILHFKSVLKLNFSVILQFKMFTNFYILSIHVVWQIVINIIREKLQFHLKTIAILAWGRLKFHCILTWGKDNKSSKKHNVIYRKLLLKIFNNNAIINQPPFLLNPLTNN